MTTEKAKNAPSPLHQHFDFTDEDVAENQQGRISEHQKRRLLRLERRNWWGSMALACFFGLLALWGMIAVVNAIVTERWDSSICASVFIPIGVLIAFVAWQGAIERWTLVQSNINKQQGRVQKLRGPLSMSIHRSRNSINYIISIQGKTFKINKKILPAFKNGAIYDLYTTHDTQEPLSIRLAGPDRAAVDVRNLYTMLGMQPDDLHANRQGHLSESQCSRIRGENIVYFVIGTPILCLPSLCGVLTLSEMNAQAYLFGVSIVMLIGFGFMLLPTVETWRDKVLMKEGLPLLYVDRVGQSWVTIKDKAFKVSADLLLVLDPDAIYRVYYTPITNTIVAAERMTEPA